MNIIIQIFNHFAVNAQRGKNNFPSFFTHLIPIEIASIKVSFILKSRRARLFSLRAFFQQPRNVQHLSFSVVTFANQWRILRILHAFPLVLMHEDFFVSFQFNDCCPAAASVYAIHSQKSLIQFRFFSPCTIFLKKLPKKASSTTTSTMKQVAKYKQRNSEDEKSCNIRLKKMQHKVHLWLMR